MLEFCRKHDGAISVFLTLILVPTLMFGGIIVDGVRIFGSKNIISGAGGLAMNGALANYDGSLNDAYGLIAMAKTPEELQSNIQDYFEASLNANGLTTEDFSKALIQLQLMEESFSANAVDGTQIYETAVMKQEVLEYMKYRAPVTLVSRGIVDKLDQFKNLEKEKEAVDSQIKFESELEDLQDKFDGLLDEVEKQKEVYEKIKSNGQISSQMQKTKDSYERMLLLGIAYSRLNGCQEAIEGELLGLLKTYNDTADGCGQGVDGFEALLKMKKLEKGMTGSLDDLLKGLDPESEEYKEISSEINQYNSNAEMWAEQVLDIKNEYETLSSVTKKEITAIYDDAKKGYDSAVSAQEKLAELKEKLDKCSELYQTWKGKVAALPSGSTYKAPMQEEVDTPVYQTLFDDKGSDEFSEKLENNKNYYEKVYQQLEALSFAGKQAVKIEGKNAVNPVAQSVSGNVNTQGELSTTAKNNFTANWAGSYRLDTGGLDKVSLEDTEFVKFLRENAKSKKEKGDPAQKDSNVKKWNEKLDEALEEYKTLLTSDDIEKIDILNKAGRDLPSVWLAASGKQRAESAAGISGNMSDKNNRKSVSQSASNAMNTNNSTLSLFSSAADMLMDAAENVCITEYVMGMLSYYTVNRDASGNEIADPLSLSNMPLKEHEIYRAEVEYVIWGSEDSRDNVTKTKALIYAVQFVSNAIYAFTNKTLTRDAKIIAAFFPVGPLAKTAIKAALLSVVAIIETTQDLNQLVKGEAVPLVKSGGGWETWLIQREAKGNGKLSMRYDDYLWILVFVNTFVRGQSILARTADCIEINRTNFGENEDKSLKEMYTMLQIKADVKTDTFFIQRIAVQNSLNYDENAFVIHYNGMQGY